MQLPIVPLTTRTGPSAQPQVLCLARKQWVALLPEEYVRQCLLHWLNTVIGVPLPLLAVERGLSYNGRTKRFDVLAHNRAGQPALLAECKAPNIALTDETARQVALYNAQFGVQWLVLTNGGALWVFEQTPERYNLIIGLPPFGQWR